MTLNLPSREHKEGYVHELFNAIAPKYDLLNTMMSVGLDKSWRRAAVRAAEVRPADQVLDICCGTGQMTMELARAVGPAGQVTGLDFSEKMLEIAQSTVDQSDLKERITLIQGNAMALPFPDNSFDAVTVGWGLRNVPDIQQVVGEMIRVVKPGRMVVSMDMGKPEMPVFKQGYWLYFEKLVPLMGKIWANEKSAYTYLCDSAKAFLNQQELKALFSESGLLEARYHNFVGGAVAIVLGRKAIR